MTLTESYNWIKSYAMIIIRFEKKEKWGRRMINIWAPMKRTEEMIRGREARDAVDAAIRMKAPSCNLANKIPTLL